ncbi:MFS transporter [Actinoplanes couchii]|uniref:MFS transporter n=1 Tax=Actinoplanes couchii TaxID=403638 RepID=A0ABQ3XHW3_9ACTN|nr:MFS transporter [Actinoplanes couchii]MDR6317696.1 MFS family permease [Actinoplanes couchii]GID58081.1 MFS transporter [Actinoplanes couchii]
MEPTTVTEQTVRSPGPLIRWQASNSTFGVPQAAAPIAFALVALPVTGSAETGAAMVFVMTAAQVLGSVPVTRFGNRFDSVRYLRVLVAVRTVAFAAVAVLAAAAAPYPFLLAAAAAAGVVTGAAHGYQRMLLNRLVEPGRLPRALGVAATLNELTFAASPVLASLLGAVSPVWAMVVVTVLGAGPMFLMPGASRRGGTGPAEVAPPVSPRQPIPREAFLWLFCAAACSSAVAAVEVGAVSFALAFGLAPGLAFVFALVLCAGSVTGGVWISVRNRVLQPRTVVIMLAVAIGCSVLILTGGHLATTLAGAAVLGFLLPQFGTFYSLSLDRLAPANRRAEIFALQRTAGSLGVITISGLLALTGLHTALAVSLALLGVAFLLAALRPALISPQK